MRWLNSSRISASTPISATSSNSSPNWKYSKSLMVMTKKRITHFSDFSAGKLTRYFLIIFTRWQESAEEISTLSTLKSSFMGVFSLLREQFREILSLVKILPVNKINLLSNSTKQSLEITRYQKVFLSSYKISLIIINDLVMSYQGLQNKLIHFWLAGKQLRDTSWVIIGKPKK